MRVLLKASGADGKGNVRKKYEVIDDDGNALPPPAPDSPVSQIVWLLEYGRKRGFRIGPRVQIGDTVAEVLDLRQQVQVSKAQNNGTPDLVPGSDMHTLLAGDED